MRAALSFLVITLRGLIRSRAFLWGGCLFYALLFLLSFFMSGRGDPAGNVKFYITVAWFLLFAYTLTLVVVLPIRAFARERDGKLLSVLGTRPVSRLGFLLSRFLSAVVVGAILLGIGCAVVGAGARVVARRFGVDMVVLSGCAVHALPPRSVPPAAVEELADELRQDTAFLDRYGEEGVRRMARQALSVWRLHSGEEASIVWEGLPPRLRNGRIRFLPRVYPAWEEVEGEFRVGTTVVRRRLRSGVPEEFAVPQEAVGEDGRLRLFVTAVAEGDVLVNFRPPDGLAVYTPEVGFLENLFRAGAVVLTVVAAVGAFGVLAGATVSYPVGILAVVVMVLLGLGSTIFTEAVSEFTAPLEHRHAGEPVRELIPLAVRQVWQRIMLWALEIMPSLGSFDPGTELAEGRIVGLSRVAHSTLAGPIVRGGVALGIAWLLFRRQELGRRG